MAPNLSDRIKREGMKASPGRPIKMKLAARLCLTVNNFFPRRPLPGRTSPGEYSQAEYRAGSISLSFYRGQVELKGKLVLDAGCGLGGKTVYYREQGCRRVVGLDRDIRYLHHADAFRRSRTAGIDLVAGCLSRLPFSDDAFDVIFLNDVVEHIREPLLLSVLRECGRVVKPQGLICLEFPPWQGPTAAHLYDYIRIPWCQCLFSRQTLGEALGGFRLGPGYGQTSHQEDFQELNRMTGERFRRLAGDAGLRIKWQRPRAVRGLSFLMGLPTIGKHFISREIFVLTK